MFGFGIGNGLHHDGELIVEALDLLQHGSVLRFLEELREAGLQGVAYGDAHVVDCGLWILVEFFVDADCVD